MNKKVKIVLIVLGALVVIPFLGALGFWLKMKNAIDKLQPMETKVVVENIYSIQDSYSNMFLIKDSTGYIVIDCGENQDVVSEELSKLQIDPDNVVAVLLTHTDPDHVGALGLFKNAKLYMSKEEEQMINGQTSRFLIFNNHISRTDYTLLEDHQVIHIGDKTIQGFLAPGHTTGSICYLVNDKYLFTGDAVSLKMGKIGHFEEFLDRDANQALQSNEIVKNIPNAQYLFTAHYGYTDDYQSAVR